MKFQSDEITTMTVAAQSITRVDLLGGAAAQAGSTAHARRLRA